MRPEDRRRHDCRPEVEPLESLTLLSIISPALSSHPSGSAEVASSTRIRTTRPVALNFTVQGSYQVIMKNPDVGRTYQFQTESTGRTHGLGPTTLDGAITTPGFVAQGYATGQLIAHTSRGDLQIQLAGPLTAGFSALPGKLSYSITGGTGKYAHAHGFGVVDVVLKPGANPSTATNVIETGHATLTFHASQVLRG